MPFISFGGALDALPFSSLFVLSLLLVGVAILIFLLCELLRSYPLIFLGIVVIIAAGALAFFDNLVILAALWLVFSLLTCIMSALHLYKNVRGAVWWSIGSIAAIIAASITCNNIVFSEEVPEPTLTALAIGVGIPVGLFLVIGFLGSLIFPRIMFRKRVNERKHLTNTDPIIGKLLAITKDAEGEFPARGTLGDVDWSIKPFFTHEKFKVGDIVKVHKIEGVTLLCTRNGKDLRAEMRAERAREEAEREAAAMARREEKRRAKEAEKIAKAQKRADEINNRNEMMSELRSTNTNASQVSLEKTSKKVVVVQSSSRQLDIVTVVTTFVLLVVAAIVAYATYNDIPGFNPLGTYICIGIFLVYFFILIVLLALRRKNKKRALIDNSKYIADSLREMNAVETETKKPQPVKIIIDQPIKVVSEEKAAPVAVQPTIVKVVAAKPAPVKKAPVKPVAKPAPVKPVPPVKVVAPAPAPAPEKAEFIPFETRMKSADKMVKDAYNELKSEILSYGIKSRVSSTGDTFRLHTKEYVKMVVAGKTLKLYLALDPKDYKDTTYPFDDASRMAAHKETPFVFKIKSALSVRRAKVLIGDAAKKDGLEQGEVVAHNHVKDL